MEKKNIKKLIEEKDPIITPRKVEGAFISKNDQLLVYITENTDNTVLEQGKRRALNYNINHHNLDGIKYMVEEKGCNIRENDVINSHIVYEKANSSVISLRQDAYRFIDINDQEMQDMFKTRDRHLCNTRSRCYEIYNYLHSKMSDDAKPKIADTIQYIQESNKFHNALMELKDAYNKG